MIRENMISDHSCDFFGEMNKRTLRKLREGSVTKNIELSGYHWARVQISNEGWQALTEAVKENRVESTLKLKNINISNDHWVALANALKETTVMFGLILCNVPFTTEMIKGLDGVLQKNRALKRLG